MDKPVLGPLLPQDRLLLQALIFQTCPQTVVEFGYLLGESAKAMLCSMREDATLLSIDINPACEPLHDPRHKLLIQDQTNEANLPDKIDFCFLDGSHSLEANQKTAENVSRRLTPGGLLVIHDTGIWPYNPYAPEYTQGVPHPQGWIHHPEEIDFVIWLREQGWNTVNLRTTHEFRHGLTIAQKDFSLC